MAIERELRLLLEHARKPPKRNDQGVDEPTNNNQPSGGSRVAVRTIFDRLRRVCRQRVLPSVSISSEMNVPELLVLVAETAVAQQDLEVARACVEWFLSDWSAKNQFYCRTQLVRAHCASMDAMNKTGAAKLRDVLNAIHFVLLVVPVATDPRRRPQYAFLVYNASVAYWQIARQLMKPATFQFLLPSLSVIIDALKAVGEKDVQWLLRLQLAMVHAQIDAKQLATAAKTVCDITEMQFTSLLNDPTLASDPSVKALYEEALRLQVHVGSFKDPECQKILANMKKGNGNERLSLVTKLQALKSGAFAGTNEAALTEIFQEVTGMAAFVVATTTDDEITAHLRGLDAASAHTVDAEVAVEAGIIAAFRQEYRLAACYDVVLHTRGKSVDSKCRVLHQVLKAILIALVPPLAGAIYKLSRQQRAALLVARRLEGMRAMERALLACKRQQDPALMESVCLYAWNLSLPLLQPVSRSQLSRVFSLAAASLEELQSLQLNLRVRLLLELGKLELSSDFVSKAQIVVTTALGLDYGVMAATAMPTLDDLLSNEAKWLHRPLDIHLVPLRKRIENKLAGEDPTNSDEELAIAVDELRETSKDPTKRIQVIHQVITAIDVVVQQRAAISSPLPVDLLLHMNTASSFAWHYMKDPTIARKLTCDAIRLFFFSEPGENRASHDVDNIFSDKSVRLLEVDLRLRLVEIIGHELKTRARQFEAAIAESSAAQSGKRHARNSQLGSQRQGRQLTGGDALEASALLLLGRDTYALGLLPSALTEAASGVEQSVIDRAAAIQAELLALKMELIHELNNSLRASIRIGWGFVVENTAIYLWNYHFHVFCMLLPTASTPSGLASILPECIAAFETTLAALEALPASTIHLDLVASVALGLALAQEKAGKLDKAAAIADTMLKRQQSSLSTARHVLTPSMSLILLKQFGELKVRLQIQQNTKEIVPVDITLQVKVASYLAAMEMLLHQTTASATLPPAQQTQTMEKTSGVFQKALTAWSPVASESLDRLKSDHFTLEDQQQQLELYCELWVRLGCGAFRFNNFKQAIDCGQRALEPIQTALSEHDQRVWVGEATWKWLAIAELLCARSMLSLLSGETAAWTLIEAALSHLVRSTLFAARGDAASVIVKAAQVAWNTVLTAMDAVEAERAVGELSEQGSVGNWWARLLSLLRDLLQALSSVARPGDRLLGDFGLLVLEVCERANDWTAGSQFAASLIQASSTTLPADQMKEIATFHAIAVATLGSNTVGTTVVAPGGGGRGKDHDPMLQAKILRKIAFSSRRNPPAQLQALTAALKELEGKTEEQALVLMDMAEWFYTHHFPILETVDHLSAAQNILVRGQRNSALVSSTGNAVKSGNDFYYAPLWYADKLIRLFTMKATVASSMPQRWEFVGHAMYQVFTAWQCILDVANDDDLRERFTAEPQIDQQVEFGQWKADQTTKFATHCPRTVGEWSGFYQQYATSLASRFHTQWVNPLAKHGSIANPILTHAVLERLLQLIASFGAFELLLPVVCLYQVVYFAFCPRKSKSMEIWIELVTYNALERLNLPVLSVPLQGALEMLQNSGDAILKELQQQEDDVDDHFDGSGSGDKERQRSVIQQSSVNVREKVAQVVEVLLRFGYVRQAKILLAMLRNVADRTAGESATRQRCELLAVEVHKQEGDSENTRQCIDSLLQMPSSQLELGVFVKLVLARVELLPDEPKAAESTILAAEKIAAAAILAATDCMQLHQPTHIQAVSKYLASLKSAARASSQDPNNAHLMGVDVDAIDALAQLKFRRACLLLQHSVASLPSVEHAQRVFQEAVALLAFAESNKTHAAFNIAFANLLIHHVSVHESKGPARQLERWLLDARGLLQEALARLNTIRSRTFEPTRSTSSVCAIPLDIEIAEAAILLASLDLRLDESPAMVSDLQMTWYAYKRDTKHTIVEKWLDQSAQRAHTERPGSASRAFSLATNGISVLASAPESIEWCAMAHALCLRSQRLELYHNRQLEVREAVRQLLWTRFTSLHAPHATWVCAANGGISSGSVEEGRSTPAPPTPDNHAVEEPTNPELGEQLRSLALELEKELKDAIERRHAQVIQVCAYELVQTYGCSQPQLAARALLMYQSASLRELHMKPLVERCLASSNGTKLHLNRIQRLGLQHTNAARNSLPFQLSQLFLEQQSDVYKRMSINVPVDAILPLFPPTTRVLSLQLSPDRCFLYAAIVSSSDKCVAMARMEWTTAHVELLVSLKQRIHDLRDGMAKALPSVDGSDAVSAAQQDTAEFVAVNTGHSAAPESTDMLENEFNSIVDRTVELLDPLFEHSALHSLLDKELPGNSLTLIVDRELELLPFEAMPCLEMADAISREFSIHLLYHRLAALKTQAFRRDDVRVVVDPRQEDTGLDDATLTSVVHQFTKKQGAAFANWKDAADHSHVTTATDWQQAMLLRKGGALVYVGPNRAIGSALRLETLAGMNLSSACYALLLVDRAENQSSARRQSKLDNDKPRWELELEQDPYACALLGSLCGINVLVLNQWTTTFHANRRLASGLLGGLAKGQSIAKTVRKYADSVAPAVVPTAGSPTRKTSTIGGSGAQVTACAKYRLKQRIQFNTAVYGLGHLSFKTNE